MKSGERVHIGDNHGTAVRTDRHGIEWIIAWDDGTSSVELVSSLEPDSIDHDRPQRYPRRRRASPHD